MHTLLTNGFRHLAMPFLLAIVGHAAAAENRCRR